MSRPLVRLSDTRIKLLCGDARAVLPTLPRAQLLERIGDYDAFIGRSATQLPAEVLRQAKKLRVIGRAGVGTDNIDLAAATELGIAVINAPGGNTVAVAELFFGTILGLLRHLPHAATSMREGKWDRSDLTGSELRGRTLGIVGLGRIGSEVSARARAFAMRVIAYDPYVTEERFDRLRVTRMASLDELLAASDIVTVHTPLTAETRGILGSAELGRMKRGSMVVNMARGGIVDEHALAQALSSGHLGGAVLDVYSKEPLPADHLFRTLPNVLLTPHLGASTAEGQRDVAVDVCEGVREVLLTGELSRAINVAGGPSSSWATSQPGLLLARRAAAIARAMLATRGARAVSQMTVRVGSDFAEASGLVLSAAAAGLLDEIAAGERLNLVNAQSLAEARGISLAVSHAVGAAPNGVLVEVCSKNHEMTVAGVAPATGPRLTRIGDFLVDVSPRRTLLVLTNADVPGVIGRVGTLLGERKVNIAEYHQARLAEGGAALAAVSVDGHIGEAVRRELLSLPDITSVTVVNFAADGSTGTIPEDDGWG